MKLLLILLLIIPAFAFSKDVILRDFVFETSVEFEIDRLRSDKYDQEFLDNGVKIYKLKEDKWKGAKKINILIQKEIEKVNTPQFRTEFDKHFYHGLDLKLQTYYDQCVSDLDPREENDCDYYFTTRKDYTPHHVSVEYTPISLCGSILIYGPLVEFSARDKHREWALHKVYYLDLHYYDLNKGVEVDPATIINPKKKKELYKLLKSRIPDHLTEMADSLDFKNSLPVFNGASFYCLLYRNMDADSDNSYALHPRLSFEEALPFLNPRGPFKEYLSLKKETPDRKGLFYNEIDENEPYNVKKQHALRKVDRFLMSLSGKQFKNAIIEVVGKKEIVGERAVFNDKGRITYYASLAKKGYAEDSVVFAYYESGALKSMYFYELDDYEDLETEEDIDTMLIEKYFLFDENENLIECGEYEHYEGDSITSEVEIGYVTYFGNRIVFDFGYKSPHAFGLVWGADRYDILNGESFETGWTSGAIINEYGIRESGDDFTIEEYRGEKVNKALEFKSEGGRIVATYEDNGRKRYNYKYTASGLPILYQQYKLRSDSYELSFEVEVEYDRKERPVVFKTLYPSKTKTVVREYTLNYL